MTDSYQVDLDHLDDVTARVAGLHTFMVETLRELDERMTALHADGSQWSGAAAAAHAQAHAQWTEAAARAAAGIERMRAAAAAARSAYTEATAANLRTLGRG